MGRKIGCPRCQHAKSWSIRRGKSRCAACHYEWVPRALPLRLSPGEWRRLLRWFVLGQSAEVIAQEARLERKRVLRALIVVRQAMVRDVPHVFSGVVEVDETYLGGSWRNRRLAKRVQGTKRGRGTTKQAVFGILCRGGLVWAQVVPNVEAKTLLPLLHQRVQRGSIVCSDTFTSYTGVAAGGYVHRLVDHSQAFSDRQGSHVNGLWTTARRSAIGKGATSTACGPQPGVQRSAREPRQRLGGLLGLSQAASGSQRGSPPRTAAPLSC
jgi:transposase-like protein